MMTAKKELPSKEQQIFKTIVVRTISNQTMYEAKEYKKGLKAADKILKKVPDHGGLE
jgi:N-alpha-acetyltransferase 15/16, NatA auxiliary subunit